MQHYMKLFEKSNDDELAQHKVEKEARRCALLAVKVPTVIDFNEVLKLKAVKYL